METLAGNDDDDDNLSSETKGERGGLVVPGANSSCINLFLLPGTASAKRDRYAKTANLDGSFVCAK